MIMTVRSEASVLLSIGGAREMNGAIVSVPLEISMKFTPTAMKEWQQAKFGKKDTSDN